MTTIGVAIPVPDPYGAELRRWRASFGDPQAALVPTHVTLLSPTAIDPAEIEQVASHLEKVAGTSTEYRIRLRGSGTFLPVSPVVFIALAEGISATEQLAAGVRSGPLERDLAFPFHPHVTVAQGLADATLDIAFDALSDYECSFVVSAFGLYTHDETAGWQPWRSFALESG